MNTPLLLIPWLVVGIPAISLHRWRQIRGRRNDDYAYFVEWKEFPMAKIAAEKLAFFLALGLASVLYDIPLYRTVVVVGILGICGYYIETTVSVRRPVPTPGYHMSRKVCARCSVAEHESCTNLRMLDGFDRGFTAEDGFRNPVCCCGFRLGRWKEVPV